jgi:Ni,Fe-hydrogenase III component G
MNEENIKQELENKFNYLQGGVVIQRKGRMFVNVPLEKFEEVFNYVLKQMGFLALSAITGLDRGDGFEVIYHLNRQGMVLLNLSVILNRENPEINSVSSICPSADIYERELVDLLGIKVKGLVPGHRYPLTDDWPKGEYPLRKDWKCPVGKKEVQNA